MGGREVGGAMDLFRKILVPMELSDLDRRFMSFIAGLGRYDVGEVMLVNVTRSTGLEAPIAARQEADRGRLIAELASILTDAGVHVSAVPLGGVSSDQIVRAAHEEGVSLIVSGTWGKSALNEFVAGSVTDTLGRKATVPVLMVPYQMLAEMPDDNDCANAGGALLERVVYPTDFSDVSERMLDLVKSLDGTKVGRVTVAHVVDPKELRTEHHREATLRSDDRILGAIAEELREKGIDAATALEVGPVIAELLVLAETREATCFIMGSHGRGISEEIFVGSVSQNMIRSSGLPVVITH